jgi:hypothetical protein
MRLHPAVEKAMQSVLPLACRSLVALACAVAFAAGTLGAETVQAQPAQGDGRSASRAAPAAGSTSGRAPSAESAPGRSRDDRSTPGRSDDARSTPGQARGDERSTSREREREGDGRSRKP